MKKILLSVFALSILLPTLAFASFDTSLKYGSRGDAVLELQDLLVAQGFLKAKVDGRYGLVTLNAVKAFQTANGLSPDGYFGKASRTKASSILADQLQSSNIAEQSDTGTIAPATSTVAGCTSTSAYSATTGQPCNSTTQPTTPNLPVGCTSTSGFSITTGQSCNGIVATVQQLQQTVQQIQQNTQQIAQNTKDVCPNIPGVQTTSPAGMLQNGNCITPASTPETDYPGAPVPTANNASVKISEIIGVDPNNSKLTARKGFDPVSFTISSFDTQGKSVSSPITVTTDDPDLPTTFTIQPNASFYVGRHSGNPQSDCSADNHDCVPLSVGTFNFTFTNPLLNVSKSVQLTVTDFQIPANGFANVKLLTSQTPYGQNIVPSGTLNSDSGDTRFVFNASSTTGDTAQIYELKFAVTDNTISSMTIGDISASPVNGVIDFNRLSIPAMPNSGYNFTVWVHYLTIGTNGLTSGTQSTATLTYYKTVGGYGSNEQTVSISTPTMTLVSSL